MKNENTAKPNFGRRKASLPIYQDCWSHVESISYFNPDSRTLGKELRTTALTRGGPGCGK